MELINEIFDNFLKEHAFTEGSTEYSNSKYFVNKDIGLLFLSDKRHEEMALKILDLKSKKYKISYDIFENFVTKDDKDVFDFLKKEYEVLNPELKKLKEKYFNFKNIFFLLTTCSVITKNYDEVVKIIKHEL